MLKSMSTRIPSFVSLCARMAYLAVRRYRDRRIELPRGFTLVQVLGSPNYRELGFIAFSRTRIVIAFRGTGDWRDLLKDIELIQTSYPYASDSGRTHKGFTELYAASVRSQVLRVLKKLPLTKKLYITGHSLGGALATLCALDVAVNTKFKRPRVVTFGSPRVGDESFANTFNRKVFHSFRVVNGGDWVPHIPLRATFGIRYRHVRRLIELGSRSHRIPLGNHNMAKYLREVVGEK